MARPQPPSRHGSSTPFPVTPLDLKFEYPTHPSSHYYLQPSSPVLVSTYKEHAEFSESLQRALGKIDPSTLPARFKGFEMNTSAKMPPGLRVRKRVGRVPSPDGEHAPSFAGSSIKTSPTDSSFSLSPPVPRLASTPAYPRQAQTQTQGRRPFLGEETYARGGRTLSLDLTTCIGEGRHF